MLEGKPFKLKLCLVGESAVGKTCLVRKFVFEEFSDKYIGTLGANITKKEIKIQHPKNDGLVDVHLMIWDIMGTQGYRELFQESYFFGAQGIIGVCDNTRENTLSDLHGWIDAVHKVTEEIPIVLLGNKCDLEEDQEVGLSELKSFTSRYEKTEPYLSSAKTGFNVEIAFETISKKIIEDMV